MSCAHPAAAQHVDRSRGTVTCTICGEVITDQQLELDPLFSRGERPGGQGRGGGLRALGQPRPMRNSVHVTPASQRPSVELARRKIYNIARQLEISGDLAELATGIYKLAVTNNAITGARNSVLCACLYAVCRREKTSHMIYDFSDATKESPYDILHYVKYLCEVTHTTVPPVDVSLLVYRFAEQLDLGPITRDVAICALKLLRSMRDDWIQYGRRPLGVVAAALIVSCNVFNVERTPEQLCGMVRLSSSTVQKRLIEFLATPAASLSSIDDYEAQNSTKPPCYVFSEGAQKHRSADDELRELAAVYYELVAEAKLSLPATEERCAKWRTFITRHCQLNNVELDEANCDLSSLSAKEQLTMLGLPHAVPVGALKSDPTSKDNESPEAGGGVGVKSEPNTQPKSMEEQLALFSNILKSNENIKDLEEQEFEFDKMFSPLSQSAKAAEENSNESRSRPMASSWEFVPLPSLEVDTDIDLDEYVIRDLEVRIKREKIGEELYKDLWQRGKPKTINEILALEGQRSVKKRRRDPVTEQNTVQQAIARALRGKGASTINLSQLDSLIPGLSTDGNVGDDRSTQSDNVSVDDDWY